MIATKFGTVTHVENGRISRGQPRLYPKGTRYQSVKNNFGTLYMRAHGMRKSNEILHGDHTILQEKISRIDHATCTSWPFFDPNADAISLRQPTFWFCFIWNQKEEPSSSPSRFLLAQTYSTFS